MTSSPSPQSPHVAGFDQMQGKGKGSVEMLKYKWAVKMLFLHLPSSQILYSGSRKRCNKNAVEMKGETIDTVVTPMYNV